MPLSEVDPRVLILAPLGDDAEALANAVSECGYRSQAFTDEPSFHEELEMDRPEEALFVVVTHEGAGEMTGEALQRTFDREPSWARLPVLFLVADAKRKPPACGVLDQVRNAPPFLVLERPVSRAILNHALSTLAEARRRQYETRDIMQQLEAAERQQRFLLDEMRHRVRNSLSVLQAMFSMSARSATSLDGFVNTFSERLQNIANAHAALSRESGGDRRLTELLRDHVEPYSTHSRQLILEGPPARLKGKVSFEFALTVHELATNAAKYGAFSTERGEVHVRWHEGEDGDLVLNWTENNGPPVDAPAEHGLGLTLVAGFSIAGASAEIEFPREGLVWRVRLPARTYSFDREDAVAR